MDEPKVQAAPKKPLTYNKKLGILFSGVPARNLTADETAAYVRNRAQYDEMLDSGAYSVADEPATKEEARK